MSSSGSKSNRFLPVLSSQHFKCIILIFLPYSLLSLTSLNPVPRIHRIPINKYFLWRTLSPLSLVSSPLTSTSLNDKMLCFPFSFLCNHPWNLYGGGNGIKIKGFFLLFLFPSNSFQYQQYI